MTSSEADKCFIIIII